MAWVDNDPFGKSAVISYYTLFSLPSLLMIVAWIAGTIFGVEAVRGKITDNIGGLIGEGASEAIEGMIANAAVNEGSTFTVIVRYLDAAFRCDRSVCTTEDGHERYVGGRIQKNGLATDLYR